MVRAHIHIDTNQLATHFVEDISSGASANEAFVLTNYAQTRKVNAKSLLGVLYMMCEYNEELYLMNETNDGNFPHVIDKYRVEN